MFGDRQRTVLIALAAVIVALAGWQMLGGPAPADPVVAAASRAAAVQVPVPPVDVRLEALEQPHGGPDETARNLFVFGVRAAAPGPARGPERPIVFAPPTPVAPSGPPEPPPIPFKFIGLVEGASGGRIAVLSDSRGLVVHGSEGAIIDGRFRILAIGTESLEIAYTDGRGRQTLRLSGQ